SGAQWQSAQRIAGHRRLRVQRELAVADQVAHAHPEHVVRGMVAALAAFFMFTVMNVFAKLLSANHSVIEIAFYRNLIASLPFLVLVFVLGRREILVIQSKPSLVGLRAVLGAVSLKIGRARV